jgi:type I restriction enzyme R subunit
MEKQLSPKEKEEFTARAGGRTIQKVVSELLNAYDPDVAAAAPAVDLPKQATAVFDDGAFRDYVENVRRKYEQIIDTANRDEVLYAGASDQARERAEGVVKTFRQFLAEKRDELTALRIWYGQPYRRKEVTFRMVQEVAEALQRPPYNLNLEMVWNAYERAVAGSRLSVDGLPTTRPDNQQPTTDNKRSAQRQLTDLVALIRFELGVDTELRPYAETVRKNFQEWVFRKQAGNVKFTEAQMAWLRQLRDFIVESIHLERDDLELGTLGQQGGLARMHQLFGEGMDGIIDELNEVLAA